MWEQFIRSLEQEIEKERRYIEPMENGSMKLFSGPSGTNVQDVTDAEIAKSRETIRNLQAVIDGVKKRQTDLPIAYAVDGEPN